MWVIIELFNIKNTETNYKNISQTEIIKSINKFKSSNVDLEFNTLGFYILEIFSIKIIRDFWLLNLNKKESEIKRMPDTSLISLLKYSAENKRIGETILLILMSLDGKNFNQLHPFFLQIVISSLNQIGLEEKAFDLVTETLIER